MPPVHTRGMNCTGHGCWPARPSTEGMADFTVRGVPVHCQDHAWAPHTCPAIPQTHASVLAAGARRMTVRGRQVGRIGDPVACGSKVAEGVTDFTVADHITDLAAAHAALTRRITAGGRATPEDKLLLCLPEIAAAQADRARARADKVLEDTKDWPHLASDARARADKNLNEAKGWRYLQRFFIKWFQAKVGKADFENPQLTRREGQPAAHVGWDWLLSCERARAVLQDISAAILNDAAKKQLTKVLRARGLLHGRAVDFDFIAAPQRDWHKLHHQFRPVTDTYLGWFFIFGADGMTAALANFSLYGLAAGRVEPRSNGGHRITVTRTAVFMRDSFDFYEYQYLGLWSCEDKSFSSIDFIFGERVVNSDFQAFRKRHGRGGDFYVYARPKAVETFQKEKFNAP